MIDGVYRPRNGVGFGDLGELERIEVLKGPQGTLFGKNTSAGVINVITKKPSFDFGSNVELTARQLRRDGRLPARSPDRSTATRSPAVCTSPRASATAFSISNRGPGPRTDDEDIDREFYTARGQLLLQPSERIRHPPHRRLHRTRRELLRGSAGRADAGSQAVRSRVARTRTSARLVRQSRPIRSTASPTPIAATEQSIEDQGASLEIELGPDIGGATLTSITAWRDWETVNGQDIDFTTVDILYRDPDGNFGNRVRAAQPGAAPRRRNRTG